MSALKRTVFPAPLGPMIAKDSPGRTRKLTSRSTAVRPKRTASRSTSRTAATPPRVGGGGGPGPESGLKRPSAAWGGEKGALGVGRYGNAPTQPVGDRRRELPALL